MKLFTKPNRNSDGSITQYGAVSDLEAAVQKKRRDASSEEPEEVIPRPPVLKTLKKFIKTIKR